MRKRSEVELSNASRGSGGDPYGFPGCIGKDFVVKRVDLVVAIVFFVMGLWVLWQATMLPHFSVFGPGPEFMPNVLGVLLMILSIVLFVTTLRKAHESGEVSMPTREAMNRIGIIVGAIFLYILLMETLGYLVTTFAYSAFMLLALWKQRWYYSLIIAAGLTYGFYWAFDTVLGVPVPSGALFGG